MSQQELASERATLNAASKAALADGSRGVQIPARFVVAGLILAIFAVVAALVAIRFVSLHRIPALTEAALDRAERLWERAGPKSYDMDLEIRGAQPGSVHIEIRDGEVTAMTRDGRSPPQRTWGVWSVPGLFETLERELVLAEDPQHEMDVAAGTELQLRCEFDPAYGFPRRYHRYATGGAPEVFWRVTQFEPQ